MTKAIENGNLAMVLATEIQYIVIKVCDKHICTLYNFVGVVPNLAEGGIDKTPKNARIPDNISYILSLYDSLP